ncbi:MAG: pyridoxal phosphate-dependent aminotransferase [Candidatus Hodarchaeales archaeon]|jgi:aspartate aminotransferase
MISEQVKTLKGSPTMFFLSMAKQREKEGHNIIHLSIGQPDFQPLQPILDTTIQAINEGKTSYTVSSGIPELRQAISQLYLEDFGLSVNPDDEIKVTTGGKLAVLAAFCTVLNRGDNIIIPEPYWVSYPDMAQIAGAKFIPVQMTSNFSLNQDELLSYVSDKKTRAILINSPNNPSSHVLSSREISFLKDLVDDYNINIISDEIYSDYIFIDTPTRTLLTEFDDWRQNLVVINGFAKTYSMTGYRLGWTVSNPEIAQGILKIIQVSTTCPANFCQWAGVTALKKRSQARELINKLFPERRRVLMEEVNKTDGLSLESIDGAFYGFVKYSFTDKPSEVVAKEILMNANVSVIPGSAFGKSAEGYLRLAFSRSISEIKEAFKRIRKYLNQ